MKGVHQMDTTSGQAATDEDIGGSTGIRMTDLTTNQPPSGQAATECSEGMIAAGWREMARFHDNDEADRYRQRLQRASRAFVLHNCPQEHGHPEGAWVVWRKPDA